MVDYTWRGTFASAEVETLHSAGFGRQPSYDWDWSQQVSRHSLGWVCGRESGELIGWVNVAWDGGVHAFLLDTVVAEQYRRRGIGKHLVAAAATGAAAAGCEWLHVDFEAHLTHFYLDECGFAPTGAGLISLG